ncbi:MAG: hypothetical protein JWM44_705 [Bacilli bacterium]|nr:hypothetical protein [Bacilli bacterium]
MSDPSFLNSEFLSQAKVDLILTVAERINQYDTSFDPIGAQYWFSSFWQDAVQRCEWDIETLNYDHCIQYWKL